MEYELIDEASDYFTQHCGVSLAELLHAIDARLPAGLALRGEAEYLAIQRARKADDPTLPLGSWGYELKRADWPLVSKLAADALVRRSKDMQFAAWLLEAQIHLCGFAGIAPSLVLMRELCENYWDQLHPQLTPHGLEPRANVLRWMNEKLLPALRLAPLTTAGDVGALGCAAWEQAQRHEQVRASLGKNSKEQPEGIALSEFAMAMAGTPAELHQRHHHQVGQALAALHALQESLNQCMGDEAPLLNDLRDVLKQIDTLLVNELRRRGLQSDKAPAKLDAVEAADQTVAPPLGALRDRADAYALLSAAADYLAQIEPHSPAPYLVRRAIKWGNLDTAELYDEVFLRSGGQISIFELLGLAPRAVDEPAQA